MFINSAVSRILRLLSFTLPNLGCFTTAWAASWLFLFALKTTINVTSIVISNTSVTQKLSFLPTTTWDIIA